MADVNDRNHGISDEPVRLPKPDSIETIPSLHPATVKMHEAMLRAVKNVVGIWETWIKERQR